MVRRFFLALLFLMALLTSGVRADSPPPRAEGGAIDLRSWDFRRDGIVELDGGWLLHWGSFADPSTLPAAGGVIAPVPAGWNDAAPGGAARPAHGFGTYRLRVACQDGAGLALALPVQHSAARWFVNGVEVARQGRPGENAETAWPAQTQQLTELRQAACPLDIVAHVSNFEARRGGLVRSVELGDAQLLHERRERLLGRDVGILGGLVVMGVLPLLFFLARRQDPSALFFGLFSLVFAFGMGLTGTRVLQPLFAPLGWELYLKLVFLCWYGNNVLYALFVRAIFPNELHRTAIRLMLAWSIVSCVVVLLAPSRFFLPLLPTLTGGAVLLAGYIGWRLLGAWRRGRAGAGLLLAGLAVAVAAVVHDTLQFHHLSRLSLVPFGIFAVVAAPAWLMVRRVVRALALEERVAIEQRERADLLMRATRAGLLDWDAITDRTRYSERFLELLGWPAGPDAPEPPPFRQLVDAADAERVHADFVRQLRDRGTRSGVRPWNSLEYRLARHDGSPLWVRSEAISVHDAEGRALRFIASFIDISESKLHEQQMLDAERVLATERERLRLLVRATRAGFSDWDAVHDRIVYTDRFKEMLGYPGDFDTANWPSIFEMMHPEDRDAARETFRAMIRRKPHGGEQEPGPPMSYRLRRRDGSWIWIHAEGISQVDDAGRTVRFITSYLDVTTLREQEQKLREQVALTRTEQRRLDLVVRGGRVGIVDWDGRTHETYYSPVFRELLGHAADADTSAWPDYFKVLIHPDERKRITTRWVAFIMGKGPEGAFGEYYAPEEYRLLRADGTYAWVRVSGMAVRDAHGFVTRWIAAVIDVSERHAQRELLERQNETLRENMRLREEVERIGRHDIKTPLNSIVAVPRLLREERRLGAEADELLGIVERAGYRILSMVNLSLDLFKMEQGSYAFRPDAVDLPDLVDKVLADVRTHAASKGVRVQVDVAHAPYLWAEELLCYSLLANLMKNAVEASPEGGVVTIRAERGEAGSVRIELHNDGVVPEAIRGFVFQKYATLGKASGTGLGTYSARLMARVQDGDVTLRTGDAEGTTLVVTLRAAPAGAVPATVRHAAERRGDHAAELTALPPTRVLLVDDDEYNLLIVHRFLPAPPFTVETAINGRVALSAAAAKWPGIVFMDLDMPVMGGLEAVVELRAMETARAGARCTMVALSSHDDEETRQRALAAGFDRYLTKPVTREVIHETLLELHFARGGEPAVTASPTAAPAVAMTDAVLVDADVEPLLPDFLASRRALVAGLVAAAQAGDRGELRRIAHQLAGSFALYGFAWAGEQARWLERHAADAPVQEVLGIAARIASHLDTAHIRTAPAPDDTA